MSSLNKETIDDIKRVSIPVDFHVSGQAIAGTVRGVGLTSFGVSIDNIIRMTGPIDLLKRTSLLLSLKIKFKSDEPNKFFRLSSSSNSAGETDLDEIKRQTKILTGGADDKYVAGVTFTQFWGIPLHLITPSNDKYFYLNLHFDTAPTGYIAGDFGIKQFFIKGLTEPRGDYEYKNIKRNR